MLFTTGLSRCISLENPYDSRYSSDSEMWETDSHLLSIEVSAGFILRLRHRPNPSFRLIDMDLERSVAWEPSQKMAVSKYKKHL